MDRLRLCAELWAGSSDAASLAKLGRQAISDSSFFTRPEPVQGPTTATLEKFARFLAEPANWPEGMVPDAVTRFAVAVGVVSGAAIRTGADIAIDDEVSEDVLVLPPLHGATDSGDQVGASSGKTGAFSRERAA